MFSLPINLYTISTIPDSIKFQQRFWVTVCKLGERFELGTTEYIVLLKYDKYRILFTIILAVNNPNH